MIQELIDALEADETGELRSALIDALFPSGIRVEVSEGSEGYYYNRHSPRVRVEVGLGHMSDSDSASL